MAVQPGSGWGVSLQDMYEALSPRVLLLLPACAQGASQGDGSPREGSLLLPPPGSSGGRLSWPAFYTTVLGLLNS